MTDRDRATIELDLPTAIVVAFETNVVAHHITASAFVRGSTLTAERWVVRGYDGSQTRWLLSNRTIHSGVRVGTSPDAWFEGSFGDLDDALEHARRMCQADISSQIVGTIQGSLMKGARNG